MQTIRCNNCLGYGHNTYSCSTINPLAQISHVQWQPKICSYCKNLGHIRSECRAIPSPQPRILTRNPVINTTPRNIHFDNQRNFQGIARARNAQIICRYCKIPGHSLEQCRKRQYNNNARNQRNRFSNFSNREYFNNPNQRFSNRENRENRVTENPRERAPENSGNRDRAQRIGATLNDRPRVRLVAQDQSQEGTPV